MLEELYKKAKEDDADMVICDYYMNDGKNQTYITQKPTVLDRKTVLGELLFQQLHGSCCNKKDLMRLSLDELVTVDMTSVSRII